MAKSSILRKLASLLFAALILLTLLSSVLYSFIAQPLFVQNKKNELLPQANWIAEQFTVRERSDYVKQITNIVAVSYNFYGVFTFIFDDTTVLAATKLPDDWSEEVKEKVFADLSTLNSEILKDQFTEDYFVAEKNSIHREFLYVFAPIREPESGKIQGTVILLQPLSELRASLHSLNISLLLATLIVSVLLIIPVLLGVRHLVQPLVKLRNLAVKITAGDFSQRTEVRGDTEISDLAKSMNQMSENLQRSFDALNHERNQLAAIIEGIREGIIAVDRDGQVSKSNSVIWQLFQRNPELMDPVDLLRITGLEDGFKECLESAKEVNQTIKLEQAIIQVDITPLINRRGDIYGAVALCHDSTESERLEQTRRDYIANISHELRSPITSMRALLEPLADGLVAEEETKRRYYQILLRENLRLSRLINDMLELSRVQSGKQLVPRGPVDLRNLLSDIALRFSLQAREEQRELLVDLPEAEIPAIWGNPDRIEQILVILFDNALKFTAEDGLIKLSLRLKKDYAELSLADEGIGIKAEDLPYVFDRFYKADKAHNEIGTGLGLSIARELADQMKARLTVTSEYGKGSTFTLELPYAQDVLRSEAYLIDVFGFDENEDREKLDSTTKIDTKSGSKSAQESKNRKRESAFFGKFNNWKKNKEQKDETAT